MKIIKPSFKILEQGEGMLGIFEQIAECASTCYKSVPKKGEDAVTFVRKLIENKHTAMLEFGTVYLIIPASSDDYDFIWNKDKLIRALRDNPHTKIRYISGAHAYYVTTNYRVITEQVPEDLNPLQFRTSKTLQHTPRYCVRLITDIGIGRELCRHRNFSFAQESTRYANYSKDKFGNELTFVVPKWSNICSQETINVSGHFISCSNPLSLSNNDKRFIYLLSDAEQTYLDLCKNGLKAEEARDVLPLCTKTEICMCGFEEDWKHLFDLRVLDKTGPAHPDMKILMTPVYEEFKQKGYI